MGRLEFSDGVSFDTGGELRVELRSDGFYVVGEGMLLAVDTRQEGQELITDLKRERSNA